MDRKTISGFPYEHADLKPHHGILLPLIHRQLNALEHANLRLKTDRRIFELGCGNGAVAQALSEKGWNVTGVDPSSEGIALANRRYPSLNLHEGSAYEDLSGTYGQYPVVLSLEVVEHTYFPRLWAAAVYALLQPGGTAIISTPYHGYWKNLALATTGQLDDHFTALWDHGHIKFWSIKTLTILLREAGFTDIVFHRVGRLPPIAKHMIAVAIKPVDPRQGA
ncbi:MAG: class I SAM-dependent methyltransferase [Thiocapsa sp.]|nr:MAG: class I SAM-dependent methyltransferase [Thiocapsa sp.]